MDTALSVLKRGICQCIVQKPAWYGGAFSSIVNKIWVYETSHFNGPTSLELGYICIKHIH